MMLIRRITFQIEKVAGINKHIPECSLKVTTWVDEMSGHDGLAAMPRWAASKHMPLAPSEVKNDNKNGSDCRDRDC